MKPPARSLRSLLLALVLAASVAACTSGPDVSTEARTSEPTAPPTADTGPVRFVPGAFTYENEKVRVDLTWEGGVGELSIENGSGEDLGAPGLYAVTQQQEHVDATVTDAAPIPDGGSATLQVTFPDSLKAADAGLIAILFGDENWGALSPVIESSSATPSG